jgi:hypothetical protein
MEDSKVEVKYTGGLGAFCYAAIPLTLAYAALIWLAFGMGFVEFHHQQDAYKKQQTYEGRREERVGINGEILKPVDLTFAGKGCIHIDRAFLDTQMLTTYVSNACPTRRQFIQYSYREVAPDGTTLHSSEQYLPNTGTLEPGEHSEITSEVSNDARVTIIYVAITDAGRPE